MRVQNARKLRDTLFIIGFFIMLGSYIYVPLIYVGTIIMLSGLIPHILYNKCPHCRRQLGRNDGEFCQHCGGKLE